jgi:hypothetical protein
MGSATPTTPSAIVTRRASSSFVPTRLHTDLSFIVPTSSCLLSLSAINNSTCEEWRGVRPDRRIGSDTRGVVVQSEDSRVRAPRVTHHPPSACHQSVPSRLCLLFIPSSLARIQIAHSLAVSSASVHSFVSFFSHSLRIVTCRISCCSCVQRTWLLVLAFPATCPPLFIALHAAADAF